MEGEIMKATSNCGNNNAYNPSNGSARAYEDSSDESIDINRDLFATKKKKMNQMHVATDDGIVSQHTATVLHSGAADLASQDSAENMIRRTSQNSRIAFNESVNGPVLTKDDEDELKLARRRKSNRDSAKRSRLRKQLEFIKLQAQVEELKAESSALKNQLFSLAEKYVKLKNENESIMVELRHRQRVNAISYLRAWMPGNLTNGEGYRREENSTFFQNRYS